MCAWDMWWLVSTLNLPSSICLDNKCWHFQSQSAWLKDKVQLLCTLVVTHIYVSVYKEVYVCVLAVGSRKKWQEPPPWVQTIKYSITPQPRSWRRIYLSKSVSKSRCHAQQNWSAIAHTCTNTFATTYSSYMCSSVAKRRIIYQH